MIAYLREMGHDVLTSYEAKRANLSIPDNEVLEFASQQGRTVLTINRRDFKMLHKKSLSHKGIIACTQDTDFFGLAKRINQAIDEQPELGNRLISIIRPNR
ncbi:MAG: DUF5615 family PIN-like protein [bacterium]